MSDRKAVLIGGNGFVGTEVVKRLVEKEWTPLCVSRSGHKPRHLENQAWADNAKWLSASDSVAVSAGFLGAEVLVCLVGSPPLPTFSQKAYAQQLKQNSEPNLEAISRAMESSVLQLVVLGAHLPRIMDCDRFAYAKGKRLCLDAAKTFAASSETKGAAVLQPTAIYGTRHTAEGKAIKLETLMSPLSKLQGMMPDPIQRLLPEQLVSVEAVADMVVRAALDEKYRETFTLISNDDILHA